VLAAGIDEITARKFQISHTLPESSGILRGWGRVQLNFQRYLPGSEIDQEIDLISLRGAPEIALTAWRRLMEGRNQLVNDQCFSAHSTGGMSVERRGRVDAEKKVQKARVPKVYLGALHKSFANVGKIGRQLSN